MVGILPSLGDGVCHSTDAACLPSTPLMVVEEYPFVVFVPLDHDSDLLSQIDNCLVEFPVNAIHKTSDQC
jgi:hypothetical protein